MTTHDSATAYTSAAEAARPQAYPPEGLRSERRQADRRTEDRDVEVCQRCNGNGVLFSPGRRLSDGYTLCLCNADSAWNRALTHLQRSMADARAVVAAAAETTAVLNAFTP
jgi:hypothetical protein